MIGFDRLLVEWISDAENKFPRHKDKRKTEFTVGYIQADILKKK